MRLLAGVGNLSRGLVLILLFVFGIRLIDGGIEDAGIVVVANVFVFVLAAIKHRHGNRRVLLCASHHPAGQSAHWRAAWWTATTWTPWRVPGAKLTRQPSRPSAPLSSRLTKHAGAETAPHDLPAPTGLPALANVGILASMPAELMIDFNSDCSLGRMRKAR